MIEKRTAVLPFTVSVCDAKKLCDGATSGELTELLCKNIGDRAEALTSAITILTCSAEMLGVSSFTVIGGGARIGLATKLTNADDQENLWTR